MVLLNEQVAIQNFRQVYLTYNNNTNKRIINIEKNFKENECVICLTNPPNILFCNCGHLCVCKECSKTGERL